jgi:hypothetical protein
MYPGTTTLIEADCDTLVMTAGAATRVPGNNPRKKNIRQACRKKEET